MRILIVSLLIATNAFADGPCGEFRYPVYGSRYVTCFKKDYSERSYQIPRVIPYPQRNLNNPRFVPRRLDYGFGFHDRRSDKQIVILNRIAEAIENLQRKP